MTGHPREREKPRSLAEGVAITAPLSHEAGEFFTQEATAFLAELSRRFEARRHELLAVRARRHEEVDHGLPRFLEETASRRESDWTVAPIPKDLEDRRVELTGPVERKMLINALNSGASVYMADFEDAHSPTWTNCVEGQLNLKDAVRGTISFVSAEGKQYRLRETIATLMVRPRGLHLEEKHFLVDGKPISASLFDFGLFFFQNARALLERGTGPYFYIPKLESHLEARLWNDIFNFAQDRLGIPRGTIRATVLVETILAAFEMDEILWELREHSAGLNCGRWDYIFSFIKEFRNRPGFVLPDRATLSMDKHFLNSYVKLLIYICHRRGIHAMGGMAAQIPIKGDPAANEAALERVRQDKLREVLSGHDGTWVAHPGLVPVAKEIFDQYMPQANQIHLKREDVHITAEDLLTVPEGDVTEEGLRWNVDVGLQYMGSWLAGNGCVPIYHLMEDAATAEISRAQIWQWVRHRAQMKDGRLVTPDLVRTIIREELEKLKGKLVPERFAAGGFAKAAGLLAEMSTATRFEEFLTLKAYECLD